MGGLVRNQEYDGALPKAELLQLNCTQFNSLEIFLSKLVGILKTKTTFIISVLKVVS